MFTKKSLLISLVLMVGLVFALLPSGKAEAESGPITLAGGSLTTTDLNPWGGYNTYSYGPRFNVNAGPVTVEYLGVNIFPINYTGDMGWPPDATDTGASAIVGLGDGTYFAQYGVKSNMSGGYPRVADPTTYGKGSWDYQTTGHWNDDGYRSYLFQGQFTGNYTETVGNSQYNAEKHGGPTGLDPDYDTFDIKLVFEKVAENSYSVTGWHRLWKSSAQDEGCYWDWNSAKNAIDPAKREYIKAFEGTWTATGIDLSNAQVFLAIQNWGTVQPTTHTFDWDSVVITGTPSVVYVDDDWVGTAPGTIVGGHTFGLDAFAVIQDGIDSVAAGGTVHVAAGTYAENFGSGRDIDISKSLNLIGAGSDQTIVELQNRSDGLTISPDATGVVSVEGIKFTKSGTNPTSASWAAVYVGYTPGTFNKITFKDLDVGYAGARVLIFHAPSIFNEVVIEDCNFHDGDIYGVTFQGTTNKLTISDSKFNHNGWNDPQEGGKWHGYGLVFEGIASNILVTHSEFNDNGTNGINMTSVTNAVFDGITANNNGYYSTGLVNEDLGVNFWEFKTGTSNLVFKNSIFNGNQRGGLAFGSEWGKGEVHNIEITGCEIKDNSHHSLLLWFDTPYSGINIHHNRIIHTGDDIALVGLLSGTQNLPDNWWGCNEGFDQPGCAWGQWALTGSFAFPSHLVMNVSTDTPFTPGGTSTFTADLTYNNLGVDTSDDGDPLTTDDGHLPPATVSFTPIDHVTPDTALLASGAASTTFAAPVPSGSFDVCATLDNETVCLPYVHDVPIITYADDSWVGYTDGTPVTVGTETHYIGYDAFDTILKAKTAVVADGGTVRVLAGTYNEAVLLDKLNLTVESLDGAAVTIIDIPDGTLTTGVKTFKNLGVITFDGFTVKDFTESGIIQGYGERAGTTFHVLNNIVKPAGTYLRNGIQVSGADSTVIGNTVYGQYLTEDWASTCIGVVNASGVLVQGNTIYGPADNGIAVYSYTGEVSDVDVIENVIEGVDYPLSVDAYYSGSTVTGVDFYRNSVTGYVIPMSAVPYPGYDGGPITNVDATYNYWGNPCGPSAVIGDVPYSPWYTDDTLTTTSSTLPAAGIYTFAPGATTAEMQTIINCAAPGSVINYASGSYPGGLVVGRDELTFNLNGVTVGAGSPAFDIYGDDIVINGPGKFDGLGAADPAIYVNTGADNFILDGVEITGWTDGVYVGGAVESLKIVNNWIHTNSGRGLVVDGTPTGVVTIKGNLFKANADAGVLYLGEGQLDATYNSWGSPTGPVGLDADKVLSTPFNFYELYFDMDPVVTGEQAWRRVAVSQTFNVALKADAANVYGLSFKFTYDPTKVVLNLTTFDAAWLNKCTMVGTPPLGTVEYFCNLTSGDPEWQGGTIATFNLTAIGSAVESFFDVFTELPFTTEPVSPTAGAVGGVKVWVNNAGYNEPFGHGLLTDEDDGRLTIDGIAQFTGFVDLEGRPNDSGALLQVFDGASVLKAKALSESSGKYTTVYEPGMWMVVSTVSPEYSVPYYLIFDRDLFLPTPLVEKFLTQEGLTTLALLKLLGGDGTNNNYIDIADAGCIGRAYGTTNNVCGTFDPILNPTPIPGANSDVTGDGIVNIYDLTLMGGNFYMGFSQW